MPNYSWSLPGCRERPSCVTSVRRPITGHTCRCRHLSTNERRPGELSLAGLAGSGGFWQSRPITASRESAKKEKEHWREDEGAAAFSLVKLQSQRLTELFLESDGGGEEGGRRRLRRQYTPPGPGLCRERGGGICTAL